MREGADDLHCYCITGRLRFRDLIRALVAASHAGIRTIGLPELVRSPAKEKRSLSPCRESICSSPFLRRQFGWSGKKAILQFSAVSPIVLTKIIASNITCLQIASRGRWTHFQTTGLLPETSGSCLPYA